jgi:hypothetical protein
MSYAEDENYDGYDLEVDAETFKQVSQLERELAAAIASFNEERERAQREGARVIELQVKLAEAVAAERERCARVCEERGSFNSMYAHHILTGAAAAIRRGE